MTTGKPVFEAPEKLPAVTFDQMVKLDGKVVRFKWLKTGIEDVGLVSANKDMRTFTIRWLIGKSGVDSISTGGNTKGFRDTGDHSLYDRHETLNELSVIEEVERAPEMKFS